MSPIDSAIDIAKTMQKHCLLLAPPGHRLFDAATRLCRASFEKVTVIGSDWPVPDAAIAGSPHDILLSFLSPRILPAACLEHPSVNFHPAPPRYPGAGGASYALYEGAVTYGATAHIMTARVDAGPILMTHGVPIARGDTCETLFFRAENACFELMTEIVRLFGLTERLPVPSGQVWSGPALTRKQFERWLALDPADPASFARKIAAARHSQKPGPFIEMHGFRFALHQDE